MALKCKIMLLLSLVVANLACCLNADTGVMYRAYKAHAVSIPQGQENSGYKKEAKGRKIDCKGSKRSRFYKTMILGSVESVFECATMCSIVRLSDHCHAFEINWYVN